MWQNNNENSDSAPGKNNFNRNCIIFFFKNIYIYFFNVVYLEKMKIQNCQNRSKSLKSGKMKIQVRDFSESVRFFTYKTPHAVIISH